MISKKREAGSKRIVKRRDDRAVCTHYNEIYCVRHVHTKTDGNINYIKMATPDRILN